MLYTPPNSLIEDKLGVGINLRLLLYNLIFKPFKLTPLVLGGIIKWPAVEKLFRSLVKLAIELPFHADLLLLGVVGALERVGLRHVAPEGNALREHGLANAAHMLPPVGGLFVGRRRFLRCW
jgi:hypothetical protein